MPSKPITEELSLSYEQMAQRVRELETLLIRTIDLLEREVSWASDHPRALLQPCATVLRASVLPAFRAALGEQQ